MPAEATDPCRQRPPTAPKNRQKENLQRQTLLSTSSNRKRPILYRTLAVLNMTQRKKRVCAAGRRSYPGSFREFCRRRRGSDAPFHHHLLDLGDRLGRVEAFRAGLGAVHDRVAAIEAERVFQVVEPLAGRLVAAVDQPAIGLQQGGRAEIPVAVPPVGRARGRAAGAQDALVEPVELGPVVMALPPFLFPAPASSFPARAGSRRAGRRNWSGRAPSP